jgi:signal transduction histidine kinase
VVKIKLYDRHGTVAFSTQSSQIGRKQGDNPGFRKAINGQVASSLLYRDTFNRFDGTTAEDNLMQTYIPLRDGRDAPPLGVFEIYTDINPLVRENERNLIIILIGAEIILALLYAVLVLLVRRARNIIDAQQQTIQERTAVLETLSAQLMNNEEQQKKKIAIDLHEGLAQTLSAVKMNVESSRHKFDASKTGAFSLEPVVQVLKTAIQEVRSIATELRPSSLDDLGLLPTINWLSREFEKQHPGNRIELDISLQEQEVPVALKIVIYRAIESAFKNIGQQSDASRTRLILRLFGKTLTLMIDTRMPAPGSEKTPDLYQRFSEMQERTTLSGGVFSATRNGGNSFILCATWPGFG